MSLLACRGRSCGCPWPPSSSPASPYVTAQLARGRSPSAARPRAGAFAGERLQQHAASGCLDHLLCCALLLCRSASGGGARQVSSSACCAQTRMASRGAGCWALSFCCAPRTAWPDGTSLSTVLDVKMVEIDARCVACPPHTPPARPTTYRPPVPKQVRSFCPTCVFFVRGDAERRLLSRAPRAQPWCTCGSQRSLLVCAPPTHLCVTVLRR